MRTTAASVALTMGVVLLGGHFPGMAGEPRREAVHRRAELEAEAEVPEWKRELLRALHEKTVSFQFVDTPLTEAIEYLANQAKITMIVDPAAIGELGNTPISLVARDVKLHSALTWILTLADMTYVLKEQAVFVTAPSRLETVVELRIYDIRDLTSAISDMPAPPTDAFLGRTVTIHPRDLDEREHILSAASIAEMIRMRISPDEWSVDLGTHVSEREGHLVIVQRPEVHRLIASFLRQFRAERALQIRVEARLLAVTETLLTKLQAVTKPREGTIYLLQGQLDLISRALDAGGEAKLVDTALITCFNGQRLHTRAGKYRQAEPEGDKQPRTVLLGTVLDVRPLVSFDRKYVTMELRLSRFDWADAPGGDVQVFRFFTTTTCLDTDTVLVAGSGLPGEGALRRLVALVTPMILRLEPAPREPREEAESAEPTEAYQE